MIRSSALLITLATLAGCSTQVVFPTIDSPVFHESQVSPVARVNAKEQLVTVGEEVTLDASSSIGPDGALLEYRWELVLKPYRSKLQLDGTDQSRLTLVADKPGSYHLQLSVGSNGVWSPPNKILLTTHTEDLNVVRFVALGDFGTGGSGQYQVARAIGEFCFIRGCDFAVGLGDNIYEEGVKSLTDPQFKSKFEDPYAGIALPFYMTLGNHDNSGISAGDGGFNRRGEIQVAYGRQPQRPSKKWQLPARYYRIGVPVSDRYQPIVDLLSFDSTTLTSLPNLDRRYELDRWRQKQQVWLSQVLGSTQSQWRIAFSHHPLYSNGKHGNAGQWAHLDKLGDSSLIERASGKLYRQFVLENLCDKVDLLISGHDHSLQLLEPQAECGKTRFIVSGSGAAMTPLKNSSSNPANWQQGDTLGFFWLEIWGDQMRVAAVTVDENGHKVAYEKLFSQQGTTHAIAQAQP